MNLRIAGRVDRADLAADDPSPVRGMPMHEPPATDLRTLQLEYEERLREVAAENELLLNQLLRVQEELERALLHKQSLEERVKDASRRLKNARRRLTHADRRLAAAARETEHLKQHISFRLGQVLLRHGRTLRGWLTLPVALLREVRKRTS